MCSSLRRYLNFSDNNCSFVNCGSFGTLISGFTGISLNLLNPSHVASFLSLELLALPISDVLSIFKLIGSTSTLLGLGVFFH